MAYSTLDLPQRRRLTLPNWQGGLFDRFAHLLPPRRHGADLGPNAGSLREKEASQ